MYPPPAIAVTLVIFIQPTTYLGGIWTPGHQEQLLLLGTLRGALALVHVLKVEQSISKKVNGAHRQNPPLALYVASSSRYLPALARSTLLDVLEEGVVLGVAVADHLHVDLLLVADVEYDVAMLFVFFDLLVCGFAHVGHGHSGGLEGK